VYDLANGFAFGGGHVKRQVVVVALFAVVGLVAATAVRPADEVAITEFITSGKQDSPLQIVGFKLPDKNSTGIPIVLLHNKTDKKVASLTLGALSGDPRVLGTHEKVIYYTNSSLGQDLENSRIAPNGDIELLQDFLRPDDFSLLSISGNLQSNCLHVAVIVSYVFFSDGTVWKFDPRNDNSWWRDSLRQESKDSCHSSPEVENTLKQLKTENWSGAPPSHPSSEVLQSYSVKCPVRTINGQLTAVCNW
jgi:hypothetical protein